MDEFVNKTGEGAMTPSPLETLLGDSKTRLSRVYEITSSIDHLMTRLGLECDYVFVGSIALLAVGLPLQRDFREVDIVVRCTCEEEENLLRALQDEDGTDGVTGYPLGEEKKCQYVALYRFAVDGILVNAWVVPAVLPSPVLLLRDLPFVTIACALQHMLESGQDEDVHDAKVITNTLLNLMSRDKS